LNLANNDWKFLTSYSKGLDDGQILEIFIQIIDSECVILKRIISLQYNKYIWLPQTFV